MSLINQLKKVLKKRADSHEVQSFTYYIPAPKPRKTGYREKQFDKLFSGFLNQDIEILNLQTVPHNGVEQSGFWVICTVKSLDSSISLNSIDEFIQSQLSSSGIETSSDISENTQSSDNVEGLYYID